MKKMRGLSKRLLSLILVIVYTISLMPVEALAYTDYRTVTFTGLTKPVAQFKVAKSDGSVLNIEKKASATTPSPATWLGTNGNSNNISDTDVPVIIINKGEKLVFNDTSVAKNSDEAIVQWDFQIIQSGVGLRYGYNQAPATQTYIFDDLGTYGVYLRVRADLKGTAYNARSTKYAQINPGWAFYSENGQHKDYKSGEPGNCYYTKVIVKVVEKPKTLTRVTLTPDTTITGSNALSVHKPVVTAYYSDGSNKDVTASSNAIIWSSDPAIARFDTASQRYISGSNITTEKQVKMNVDYTENGVKVTSTVPAIVTVKPSQQQKTLQSITVYNTSVEVNSTVKPTIYANYNTGSELITSGYVITSCSNSNASPYNSEYLKGNKAGTATFYVSYGGKTGNAVVTVIDNTPVKTLQSITVYSTSVEVNNTVRPTIYANYNTGSELITSGYVITSCSNSNASPYNSEYLKGNKAGTATFYVSYGGKTGNAVVTIIDNTPVKTLEGITVSNLTLEVGEKEKPTIIANYNTGDEIITTGYSIKIDNTSKASVNSTYYIKGVAEGSTGFTVTYQGEKDSAIVTVVDNTPKKTLEGITVSNLTLEVGEKEKPTIIANYNTGDEIIATGYSIKIDNTSKASVNSTYYIKGVAEGSTGFTVTYQGETDSAIVTVIDNTPKKTLEGITVSNLTLEVGEKEKPTIIANYNTGDEVITTGYSIKIDNTSKASVNSTYYIKGVAAGSSGFTVTYQGETDSAIVTVVDNTPVKTLEYITVTPASITQYVGDLSEAIVVKAYYNVGSAETVTSSASITVANTSIAAKEGTKIRGVKKGNTTVNVTYQGESKSIPVTILDNEKPEENHLIGLQIFPSTRKTIYGLQKKSDTVSVRAIYSNGPTKLVTNDCKFESEDQEVADVIDDKGTLRLYSGSKGSKYGTDVIINVKYTDKTLNESAEGTIDVRVVEDGIIDIPEGIKILDRIEIEPSSPETIEGEDEYGDTFTVTAYYHDSDTNAVTTKDVTNLVTWKTTDDDIAYVKNNRARSGDETGTVTFTASYTEIDRTVTDSVRQKVKDDDDDDDDDDDINPRVSGLKIEISNEEDSVKYREDTDIVYYIDYYNGSGKDKENVTIELEKPKKMDFVESDLKTSSKGSTKIVWDIGTLEEDEDGRIEVVLTYEDVKGTDEVELVATILEDDKERDDSSLKNLIYEKGATGYHNAYMIGYPDGSFRPENTITRQEMAAALVRLFNLGGYSATSLQPAAAKATMNNGLFDPYYMQNSNGYNSSYGYGYDYNNSYASYNYSMPTNAYGYIPTGAPTINSSYTSNYYGVSRYKDVTPESCWGYNEILIATSAGLFTGYPDGTFRPEAPVSKAEFLTIVANRLNVANKEPLKLHFREIQNFWASNQIEQLYRLKLLLDTDTMSRNLNMPLTRVEAATLLNRVNYRGPLNTPKNYFWDVTPYYPGYGHVQEAATSHSFIYESIGDETER